MKASLTKFFAGTAQSQAELKNLVDAIPRLDMSEVEFKASLRATEENVMRKLEQQQAVIEESGGRGPSAKPSMSKAKEKAFQMLKKSRPNESDEAIRSFLQNVPDDLINQMIGE